MLRCNTIRQKFFSEENVSGACLCNIRCHKTKVGYSGWLPGICLLAKKVTPKSLQYSSLLMRLFRFLDVITQFNLDFFSPVCNAKIIQSFGKLKAKYTNSSAHQSLILRIRGLLKLLTLEVYS